jgi:hypothetical protein
MTHQGINTDLSLRLAVTLAGAFMLSLLVGGPACAASPLKPDRLAERGLQYLHAEGEERDTDRAIVYLCAAALKQQGMAAFELGWLYFQGRGVPRDDGLAAAWLREARRLGEEAPPWITDSLAAVEPKPLRCVASNGVDLHLTDPRRVDLLIAIYEIAPQYELDPALVREVVRAESNFNPKARSPRGAIGLMQLIPSTAKRFGVADPLEPIENLHGGMAYLRWLQERFDGDVRLMLAGYNAGEGAVERHGGVPPYAETRTYVKRILQRYGAADSYES